MKVLKKNKGFTLIELLVTIGIIGILGGVSIVGYTSYTQTAAKATAKTMAQSIFNSLKSCAEGSRTCSSSSSTACECITDVINTNNLPCYVSSSTDPTTNKCAVHYNFSTQKYCASVNVKDHIICFDSGPNAVADTKVECDAAGSCK